MFYPSPVFKIKHFTVKTKSKKGKLAAFHSCIFPLDCVCWQLLRLGRNLLKCLLKYIKEFLILWLHLLQQLLPGAQLVHRYETVVSKEALGQGHFHVTK